MSSPAYSIIYVNFLLSPIFGVYRKLTPILGTELFSWIFWYTLYLIERLGVLVIFGLLGIYHFRKEFKKNGVVAFLLSGLFMIYISIHFFKLPGPQNEYAKNATLIITYSLGIFMAGYMGWYVDIKRKGIIAEIKHIFIIIIFVNF